MRCTFEIQSFQNKRTIATLRCDRAGKKTGKASNTYVGRHGAVIYAVIAEIRLALSQHSRTSDIR